MINKAEESEKKEYADFQDQYRRSSNFSQINEDETKDLAIEGDGEVHFKNLDEDEESDEEKINDALNILETEEE